MKTADQMTKQEIIDELTVLGLSVDKTAKVDVLRAQLMAANNSDTVVSSVPTVGIGSGSRYIKHPINGRVFEVTDDLLRRGDMLPATEEEYRNQ